MHPLRLGLVVAVCGATGLGCSSAPPPPPPVDQRPEILGIEAPTPVLEGSVLRVTGLFFEVIGPAPVLRIAGEDLPLEAREPFGQADFRVTGGLVAVLGPGFHAEEAVLIGDAGTSDPYPVDLDVVSDLSISLSAVPSGTFHRNDVEIVRGDGMLAAGEGSVTARFDGTFTLDAGGSVSVNAVLPVVIAERNDRTRGLVRLTTAIGGMHQGTFDGTVTLESDLVSGGSSVSSPMTTSLRFLGPELYAVEPNVVFLEQYVVVRGAGFLGGPTEADETTIVRLEGTFEPESGLPRAVSQDLVLEWVSGTELRAVVSSEQRSGYLVSSLFGTPRGVFTGRATPTVIKGAEEQSGPAVDFILELGGMKQVVYVRFVPAFYESLARFGLAGAAGSIEARVRDRIQSIYSPWNIDIRLERPTDFGPNGYATIEIGGPDPNGVGLFGYDNTPGKDVNNLRLFDKIGGANAETQEDGARGYGGVFVESFLYFSQHPDLPGDPPLSPPDPDPYFDELFDPVRRRPATLAELSGSGDPARVDTVLRALDALGSMIGETTAHELGHSFGLADPRGAPTVFHDPGNAEGCLMDSGGARPIGERTAQPGFATTELCYDAPGYLDEIVPLR